MIKVFKVHHCRVAEMCHGEDNLQTNLILFIGTIHNSRARGWFANYVPSLKDGGFDSIFLLHYSFLPDLWQIPKAMTCQRMQVKKAREEGNVGTETEKFEDSSGHTCTQAFNSEKSSMFLAQHHPHPLRVQCPALILCQNMSSTAFNTEHSAAALAARRHKKNHHCIRELRPCLLPLPALCFCAFCSAGKDLATKCSVLVPRTTTASGKSLFLGSKWFWTAVQSCRTGQRTWISYSLAKTSNQ